MGELNLIAMLAPVAVLQIVLAALGLWDLHGQAKAKYFRRAVWAVIIVVLGIIGPLAYFLFGREQ